MAQGIVLLDRSVEGAVGDENPLPIGKEYTVAIENDGSGNPIYIGHALPGTAKSATGWRIKKIIYSGSNVTDIAWASGTKKFDKIWDSRGDYVYS